MGRSGEGGPPPPTRRSSGRRKTLGLRRRRPRAYAEVMKQRERSHPSLGPSSSVPSAPSSSSSSSQSSTTPSSAASSKDGGKAPSSLSSPTHSAPAAGTSSSAPSLRTGRPRPRRTGFKAPKKIRRTTMTKTATVDYKRIRKRLDTVHSRPVSPPNGTSSKSTASGDKKTKPKVETRLGWKTGPDGKRCYHSLDGQIYQGKAAVEQSKLDSERRKSRLQHPVSDRVLEQALNQDNRSSSPTAKQSPSSDSDKTIPKDDRVKQEDTAIPEHLKEVSSWIPGISMVYEQHGVRLYDWQVECMRQAVRQQNKNLLVSAPTSSGKTLIAELLMCRALLRRPTSKAIVVLPYVSIVREKTEDLAKKLAPHGLAVSGFYGAVGGTKTIPPDVDIAVCTIEKANMLCGNLLRDGELDIVSSVVIDELHMIGLDGRGYGLELLLNKVLDFNHRNSEAGKRIQVLGMSATIPNLSFLAKWMDAWVYETDFRPVELNELIKCDDEVQRVSDGKLVGKFRSDTLLSLAQETLSEEECKFLHDENRMLELVLGATQVGDSVLVFCPTREWCENGCRNLKRFVQLATPECLHPETAMVYDFSEAHIEPDRRISRAPGEAGGGDGQEKESLPLVQTAAELLRQEGFLSEESLEPPRKKVRLQQRSRNLSICGAKVSGPELMARRMTVCKELEELPDSVDTKELRTFIREGIAFHHAGLTCEERGIVEQAFREGTVSVLYATTTLAAGVNLPARRVIIREVNPKRLKTSQYKQMCGRAGRTNQRGMIGESIVMVTPKQESAVLKHLRQPLEPVRSRLFAEPEGSFRVMDAPVLGRKALEAVAVRTACRLKDIIRYARLSLYAQEKDSKTLISECKEALRYLLRHQFIVPLSTPKSEPSPEPVVEEKQSEMAGDGRMKIESIEEEEEERTEEKEIENQSIFYQPTALGLATFGSGLPLEQGLRIYQALTSLRKQGVFLVNNTDIHLCYALAAGFWDDYPLRMPDFAQIVQKLELGRSRPMNPMNSNHHLIRPAAPFSSNSSSSSAASSSSASLHPSPELLSDEDIHILIFGVQPTPSPKQLNRRLVEFLGLQPEFLMWVGPDLSNRVKRLATTLPEPTLEYVTELRKELDAQRLRSRKGIERNTVALESSEAMKSSSTERRSDPSSQASLRLNPPPKYSLAEQWKAAQYVIAARFRLAVMMDRLSNEESLRSICALVNTHSGHQWSQGLLQQLQERTSTMAGMVMVFCEQLHWRELAILFADLAERLTFGVKTELLPLMRIPGVKAHRARALYEGGITSLEELAEASVMSVVGALGAKTPHMDHKSAAKNDRLAFYRTLAAEMIKAARDILQDDLGQKIS